MLANTVSVQTVTDDISRRVASGRENKFDTCLEGYYRNVTLL